MSVRHPAVPLIRAAVTWLLRRRYRVEVRGLDAVRARGARGILFMPNHPALADPVILLSVLHREFAPAILADQDRLDVPVLRSLARLFGAIPMPDVARHGGASRPEVEDALRRCAAELEQGRNLLFYPAGRLHRAAQENLGANSGAANLLQQCPAARVVLVRVAGLWGSVTSYGRGERPEIGKALFTAIGSLLVSFLFFVPRRTVTLTFEEPADLPRSADRLALNRALETFYNRDLPPCLHVPYSPWERGGPRVLPEPDTGRAASPQSADIPAFTRHAVIGKLAELAGVPADKIRDDLDLARDLGLDSLTLMEFVAWAEKEFGYPFGETPDIRTVGDLLLAACGNMLSAEAEPVRVPAKWFRPPPRAALAGLPPGRTIPEVFLAQARRAPGRAMLADAVAGVKTNRELLAGLILLKTEIAKLPEPYVGVMLPASVTASLVFLAVQFAGKIPVMVNWTAGPRHMRHALDLLGVRHILTARRVVERIEAQFGPLAELADRFDPLENLRATFTARRKLAAFVRTFRPDRALPLEPVQPTAVVLFTSGSENLPKAVPLTHENILVNLRDVLSRISLQPRDVILGMLPPFHSYGLSTNVIIPLCVGIPCTYHPNPTEGLPLARIAAAYGVTVALGTPTFLAGLLRAAGPRDLRTLRLVITGAEKCPDSLYESVRRFWPQAAIIEGYGITECSPIVSMNDEHDIRPGTIGRVLPSIEWACKNPESDAPAAPDQPGLLLVRGASIFGGYLHYEGPSTFLRWQEKDWYVTGDLVTVLPGGVLRFAGRLKRFIKLGGEMISLPAIEETLLAAFGKPGDKGPCLAIEATPVETNPEIVLFTAGDRDVSRESANDCLRKAGFSPLHNVRAVVRLEEIPLLGTGKVHYRALRDKLAAGPAANA